MDNIIFSLRRWKLYINRFWALFAYIFALIACQQVTLGPVAGAADITDAQPTLAQPTQAGGVPSSNEADGIWSPGPGTSWQWQLQGTIDTSIDVDMYDIDLFDSSNGLIDDLHNDGRRVICYFSAGSWEDWRSDAGDFPESVKGNPLDGWPGEKWLDVRDLVSLGPIMAARLDLAAAKGCDGVEPDNVDGYSNDSGFPLSGQDQLDFNLWLATQAHARGLSIGLKNDLEQIAALEPHFDWALNEQCFEYNECETLLPFIQAGKAVFGVEYQGDPDDYCPQSIGLDYDWLAKNLDLDAWRLSCREVYGEPPPSAFSYLPLIRRQ
jgi:hypothetical protein